MDSMYPSAMDDESDSHEMDEKDGEEKDEGQTTLIPASMFGGKMPEPGTECTFRVKHCYDDECEVEYVSQEKPEKEQTEMDKADERLGEMASPNA